MEILQSKIESCGKYTATFPDGFLGKNKERVTVTCSHGARDVLVRKIKEGCYRCRKCNALKGKEGWVAYFRNLYEGKYSYTFPDKGDVSLDSTLSVECKIHGEFQLTVRQHKTQDCSKCRLESSHKRRDTEMLKELTEKGYTFKLPDGKSLNTGLYYKDIVKVTCQHKSRNILVADLREGVQDCTRCSRIPTLGERFTQIRKIHGNVYDYEDVEGKSVDEYITLVCKTHGKYSQQLQKHLRGHGCGNCSKEVSTGYNKVIAERWKEKFLQIPAVVYIMRVNGVSWKVGVSRSLAGRLSKLKSTYDTVSISRSYKTNLYHAIMIEQDYFEKYRDILPHFAGMDGYTEIFNCPDLGTIHMRLQQSKNFKEIDKWIQH